MQPVLYSRRSDVMMSHVDPAAAGFHCTECHIEAGHAPGSPRVQMTRCIRCHDGQTASAACPLCHRADTNRISYAADRTDATDRDFPKAQLPSISNCAGCHTEPACDACHGLPMPHPASFSRWEHAQAGPFGSSPLCLRCHVGKDCERCHPLSPDNGGRPPSRETSPGR